MYICVYIYIYIIPLARRAQISIPPTFCFGLLFASAAQRQPETMYI